jgi:hypothetical protein
MENPRLSGSINRITVLRKDPSGFTIPVVVYKRASKGKKGSRTFKAAEKATRRMAKAQRRTAADYIARHDKSNRKKKDGWVRDWLVNSIRSENKGVKALKLRRMFSY